MKQIKMSAVTMSCKKLKHYLELMGAAELAVNVVTNYLFHITQSNLIPVNKKNDLQSFDQSEVTVNKKLNNPPIFLKLDL